MLTLLTAPKDKWCRRAVEFLDANGIKYANRDIIEDHPTIDELRKWMEMSGLSAFAFLHSGGFRLSALAIGERLAMLNEESRLAYIAATGKIVRRPILVGESFVLVGFDDIVWARKLNTIKSEQ